MNLNGFTHFVVGWEFAPHYNGYKVKHYFIDLKNILGDVLMSKIIEVKDGLSQNGQISGKFRLLRDLITVEGMKRDRIAMIAPMSDDEEMKAKIGTHCAIHVWLSDINVYEEEPPVDKKAILENIRERFYVMSLLTEGLLSGNIRSFIMAGSAGIGKSFNLINRLDRAKAELEINQYNVVSGRLSAVVLFKMLYEHSNEGDVLVLDDVDVFSDDKSLEVLKAALDTTRRPISWGTVSHYLDEEGVPTSFDFNGSVVFISNQNFDRLAAANSRLAPHVKALISRSIYLDLLIHDSLEIMIWVDHVVRNENVLQRHDMTEQCIEEILEWMWANYKNLRELSLRTPEHLANFTKCHGDWRLIANATMLRRH